MLKDASPEQLIASVRLVAAGDALVAPAVTRRLIERFATPVQTGPEKEALAGLTVREIEVLN